MPNHPFCFKIKDAAAHTKYAHELTADLMTMPDYFRLEYKYAHLLETTRNHLRRMAAILTAIYPHAVDIVYVQPELPSLEPAAHDDRLEAYMPLSPHNAQPPDPE